MMRSAPLSGKDREGARLTSEGEPVEMVIDSIGPKVMGRYSRHVKGQASARRLPKDWRFVNVRISSGALIPICGWMRP